MLNYILRRLLHAIPVVLGIATIVFFLMSVIPGDPVAMRFGPRIDKESIERIKKEEGLDKPLIIQYVNFICRIARLDFGRSYIKHENVSSLLFKRKLFITFQLAIASVILSSLVGMTLGVIASFKQNSWLDGAVIALSLFGISTPVFWLGLMLIFIFSQILGWLPLPGSEMEFVYLFGKEYLPVPPFKFLILPTISLSALMVGYIARMTRSSMLEVLRLDYIRTAYAKGLTKARTIIVHGLRNALIPVVTIIGLNFASLLGGAIATETIFAWPGIGTAMFDAINQRDIPVIEAGVIVLSISFVLVNIIVDISYAFLDPRIRLK